MYGVEFMLPILVAHPMDAWDVVVVGGTIAGNGDDLLENPDVGRLFLGG